jgi:hypothetical protein
MKRIKRTETEWQALITECQTRKKGITIKSWCEQKGISYDSYKYWKEKLNIQTKESTPCFAKLDIPYSSTVSTESDIEPGIHIQYKGFEITFTQKSSRILLAELLTLLRSSC